ncbi:MAG: nitroreductase family protein [Thermotogae bacterium]|nr:MAG: nitroreductase family protein [Thermotogota bacterium]
MNCKEDIIEVMLSRRSIRKFADVPVQRAEIERILRLATDAPSAGNRQPWKMYAVSNEELKRKLMEAAYGQEFVYQAPWVVVVCALPERSAKRYGERGEKLYSIQDTAALVTYMMLLARACDLDTCWVGAFNEEAASAALNLPPNERPVAMIPIGHRAQEPKRPPRRDFNEVIEFRE